MTTPSFDDETLMAFADGQLDEPEFSAVSAALEGDTALAARLEAIVVGKDLVRAVYGPLIMEPIPARVQKSVEAAIASAPLLDSNVIPMRKRATQRLATTTITVTLAAACLAAIVAGPIGFLLGAGNETGGEAVSIGQPLPDTLVSLIAGLPSGEERRIADGMTLHPIATFSNGAGHLCREFELRGAESLVAIACRQDEGWVTTFAMQTGTGNGYAAASSLEPLDAYLTAIVAGPPYSTQEEAAVLAGN